MANFSKIGIHPNYVKSINELNIFEPTPVQEQVIPFLINNKSDIVVQAQTGTGKTAAFGLPILHHINPKSDNIQALVLSPTRELSQQIAKQLFKFTKYNTDKIFTEAVYGGEHISKQLSRLTRTTHVLVATPGRLVDLLERKVVDLSKVRTVVLDEADEMLHMGFKKELESILNQVPGKRNTWLFSATIPKEVKLIINNYLSADAESVQVSKEEVVNKNIEHQFVVVREHDKLDMLIQFLKSQGKARGVIFCTTKKMAITLSKQLKAKNYNCEALQGDMHQKDRDKVMRGIKNKSLQILVSTDVAARGIDIDGLSYVVHFDVPSQLDFYTHRSGRTARGGKKGMAISFVTSGEINKLKAIEKELGIRINQIR
ncbi:MAG: DEAD/DEAH box helicase [Salibacteraceae bacterium]